MTLTYSLLTPVRDEEANLPRLIATVEAQVLQPQEWLIIDNGSIDASREIAGAAATKYPWIALLEVPGEHTAVRGRPIVQALHAGIRALNRKPDILVSVDADVSFASNYIELLLGCFEADPCLGIASGSGYERHDDKWFQRHVTGSTVWGASRAYRWQCLQDVLPLEERLGWDGIDEFKANARGWRTQTFQDIPFYHHRREGERDRRLYSMRFEQGRTAHFTGYRPLYLIFRTLFHARREPAALGLLAGYASAALRREQRIGDAGALRYVRHQQRLSALPTRLHEALGKRS